MAEMMEQYTLMHKGIPVADITLDAASGGVSAIGAVHAADHMPVGVALIKGEPDRAGLNAWWQRRAIPASRLGIRAALAELKVPGTQFLLDKCLGLSLSDQYWIRPVNSKVSWHEVNFYENPFSEDVGNILFGKGLDRGNISLMSPDNTSDGWLQKKWKIIDGRRCLIKGGSGATRQEPYNEVLASSIMERLKIPLRSSMWKRMWRTVESDERMFGGNSSDLSEPMSDGGRREENKMLRRHALAPKKA